MPKKISAKISARKGTRRKKPSKKGPSPKRSSNTTGSKIRASETKKTTAERRTSGKTNAKEGAPTPTLKSTREFYFDDYPKALFPLLTNQILIRQGEQQIQEYIKKCLDDEEKSYAFLPQKRVYASKAGGYLRRTVKLDAVAEYYIYDVIFRNRKLFRKPYLTARARSIHIEAYPALTR